MKSVDVHASWKPLFTSYFETGAGKALRERVRNVYITEQVFPLPKNLFNAFNTTPLESVQIVILGQDPYHGDGQAHGFSFSVPEGVNIPPSLQNIYKEIENDTGQVTNKNGNLEHWARQGVFLLNAILTVRAHNATSHRYLGWEDFTDAIIREISNTHDSCIFMLWGSFAKQKEELIDVQKHLVLKTVHPSPLSAYRGFLGCQHFSAANTHLKGLGKKEIIW